MELITYKVNIPRLSGLTEEQRNKAIEDYMRESQRQLRMIHDAIKTQNTAMQNTVEQLAKTVKQLQETVEQLASENEE